jgi:5-oxoprolinase (ATP-hydrolysing)
MPWQFWIDVGGTFTDGVACSPDGVLQTVKVLSSGVTKGRIDAWIDADTLCDASRLGDAADFWTGYRLHVINASGARIRTGVVRRFDAANGTLRVQWNGSAAGTGSGYELESGEEAPLLAIRRVLGLPLDQPFPSGEVRLGTTRGTNALVERKGARVAFVTTRGFADVLRIANQDRPRLFDLTIRKPEPLYETVIEVDERLAVDGAVLRPVQTDALRRDLTAAYEAGIRSLAVCLIHSWINPAHELAVESIARDIGFEEISLSHRVSPRIKIVPRGDTTVVDAYLSPCLREYVDRLSAAIAGGDNGTSSRLRMMTSSGGLVSADRFTGRDSLLSGPAGGVIGFSRVAERAGFPRAIGFDMGGTSTDVARYDGRYDFEYETTKAGVRVATPMLAIETVAAGGGSICGFDGVQLFVGPHSAGADPGPACYGRGGPLTITDCNLALGRLLPEEFPFALDATAVASRLQDLCQAIANGPQGRSYSPQELAEGFVRLANANMTRAIRKISVAKGYNPADYALVTFGGAGGQHACALADALGMDSILVHPLAGVLSAYGMGLADVRRQAERPVLQPYSHETLLDLEPAFNEIEAQLRRDVLDEGILATQIDTPTRSLDLRYRGVEATITVPRPTNGDYAAGYGRRHEQLYGYRHDARPIEIAALRVEVVGRTPDPPVAAEAEVVRHVTPQEWRDVWFEGRLHMTGVVRRSELLAGDVIAGPAILCEPTSTLVIEPGWQARVAGGGEVVLTRSERNVEVGPLTPALYPAWMSDQGRESIAGERENASVDPVTLEVFNNHFASIAEQMGVTLQRTAISTNVKERLDFSCAIFDAAGRLVVNAPHIPVHLGAMGETVQAVLADNPGLAPGDVIVTNDPYRGGSHLPDVTVVTPVHDPDSGELLFVTASRAHHAEIGGIVPGSVPPFSRNLAEEGVLIRNFRLVSGGESREAALRELLLSGPYPTRRVEDNLADVAAQAAANRMGAKLLLELVAAEGFTRVADCMQQIRAAAALKLRRALARHGTGVYERVDHLDDGSPIAARITIEEEQATIDFTGTGPVLATNLNANRAIVTAAVMYVFRCLINEDIPLNGGVLEPLTIVLPPCLLYPPSADDPRECPAIVGGNVETSQRVVDVLLGALGLAAASQGTMNNLAFGDDRFGYYETICGGSGATAEADGADAVHTHMTNTRLTDVEVMELRYPVRVAEFRIRRGSGGSGLHRGGDGVLRRLEFLRPLKVSMLSQRRQANLPFGLRGGKSGAAGRNLLQSSGEAALQDLGGSFQIDVAPGDSLHIETPGGGGWGEPSR